MHNGSSDAAAKSLGENDTAQLPKSIDGIAPKDQEAYRILAKRRGHSNVVTHIRTYFGDAFDRKFRLTCLFCLIQQNRLFRLPLTLPWSLHRSLIWRCNDSTKFFWKQGWYIDVFCVSLFCSALWARAKMHCKSCRSSSQSRASVSRNTVKWKSACAPYFWIWCITFSSSCHFAQL